MMSSLLPILQEARLGGAHVRSALQVWLRSESVEVILRVLPQGVCLWTEATSAEAAWKFQLPIFPPKPETAAYDSCSNDGSMVGSCCSQWDNSRESLEHLVRLRAGFRTAASCREQPPVEGNEPRASEAHAEIWSQSNHLKPHASMSQTCTGPVQGSGFRDLAVRRIWTGSMAGFAGNVGAEEPGTHWRLTAGDVGGDGGDRRVATGESLQAEGADKPGGRSEYGFSAMDALGGGEEGARDSGERGEAQEAGSGERFREKRGGSGRLEEGGGEQDVQDKKKERGQKGRRKRRTEAKVGKTEKEETLDVGSLLTAVLVGRPNVGKSALFNRLTQRQEALVYNTPAGHVTRDHREGIGRIGDLRLRVIDTAGLEPAAGSGSVLARTAKITQGVLRRSQLALFLLDGRSGLQPHDEEVATWLRRSAPHLRVVLLVNKCEGVAGDLSGTLHATLGEAHRLGLGDPIGLSAETGEGLADLYDRLRPLLEEEAEEEERGGEGEEEEEDAGGKVASPTGAHPLAPSLDEDQSEAAFAGANQHGPEREIPLQLAICGRPNVGKSTLLNALLGHERALTGPEPGLTRDSVRDKLTVKGREIWLVDTAGWIQRAELRGRGPEAMSAGDARRRLRRAQVVALLLDASDIASARSTLKRSEMALARWVGLEGRALVVVVNKMDTLDGASQAALRRQLEAAVPQEIHKALPQVGAVPIVFTSALRGPVHAQLLPVVLRSYERWCTRLSTAVLNKWLEKVMARSPRQSGYGSRVRYLTQVKARPPTFVAFTSGAAELPDSEMRFLEAALREDFDLAGTPIRVHQRHKARRKVAR